MKSIHVIGTLALMCSSMLFANEMEDETTLSFEMLSLPELLSYVEDTVQLIIKADDETYQLAYYELRESLRIIYALNCLHRYEVSVILQVLDECYADLIDAIDKDPGRINILEQSLLLFASGHNYDHPTFAAQSLQDWTNTTACNELKSAIDATNADLVYIQNNALSNVQKDIHGTTIHASSRILYNVHPSRNSSPKILIIKHDKNKEGGSEYKAKAGVEMKLGGKDHGKTSLYFEGEIKDKDGNYLKGKASKEKGDDGYNCELEAGTEKKKK